MFSTHGLHSRSRVPDLGAALLDFGLKVQEGGFRVDACQGRAVPCRAVPN